VNPKVLTNVPGPGAHEPKDEFSTKQNSSQVWTINRIDKNKKMTPIKHPGPQDYNIPSYITEHAQFGFGLRPPIDPLKCRTTTGPGDYDPKYPSGYPKISISGRPNSKITFDVPGPGSYNDMR
jgi:hypothetical protein